MTKAQAQYEEAVKIVRRCEYVSESVLQRRLKIPFKQARTLMIKLAIRGVVGEPEGRAGYRRVKPY